MRRIRAMSLGIELIINNGVSSSGRIPDITGEAGQVNSILADRLRKSKLCMKKDKAFNDIDWMLEEDTVKQLDLEPYRRKRA